MSDNFSLIANSLDLAMEFLVVNGAGDGRRANVDSSSRSGFLFYGEETPHLKVTIEVNVVHGDVTDRLAVTAVQFEYVHQEEDSKVNLYMPIEELKKAYAKDKNGPIWIIMKPIDMIVFLKTFNQHSIDLGYKPILKS